MHFFTSVPSKIGLFVFKVSRFLFIKLQTAINFQFQAALLQNIMWQNKKPNRQEYLHYFSCFPSEKALPTVLPI